MTEAKTNGLWLAAALAVTLAGCGGGSGGGSSTTEQTQADRSLSSPILVEFNGLKGPLAFAQIKLYPMDTRFSGLYDPSSTPVAETQTDETGRAQAISIPEGLKPPFVVVVDGTRAMDVTTSRTPVIPTLTTIVTARMLVNGAAIYATPLTTLAVTMTATAVEPAGSSDAIAERFEQSAKTVASTFGFGLPKEVDILTTPAVFSSRTGTIDGQQQAAHHRAAIEAFASITFELAQRANEPTDALINELAKDLASDGKLDRSSGGETLDKIDLAVVFQDPARLVIADSTITVQDIGSVMTQESTASILQGTAIEPVAPLTLAPASESADSDGDGVLNIDETNATVPSTEPVSHHGLIPQSAWRLVYTNSQETAAENGAAVNAFDGNPATYWHTEWSKSQPIHPHELRIDLGAAYEISALRYLPRQDRSTNGQVTDYRVYVSNDGKTWGDPITTGTLPNTKLEQSISVPATLARYIRFVAMSEINNNRFASIAELNVIGRIAKDQNIIVSPTDVTPTSTTTTSTTTQSSTTTTQSSTTTTKSPTSTTTSTAGTTTSTTSMPSTTTTSSTTTSTRSSTSTSSTTTTTQLNPPVDGHGVIPQTSWRLVYTDSQETNRENSAAVNAFDGNPSTYWHTEWYLSQPAHAHEIQIDLGATYELSELRYLPRQDTSNNGQVKDFQVFLSNDTSKWGSAIASGTFANSKAEQSVSVPLTTARYVRFVALSEVKGRVFTSVAEITAYGALAPTPSPDPVADPSNQPGTNDPVDIVPTGPAVDDPIDWPTQIAQATGSIYFVSTASEFNATAAVAQPGDVVILKNGTYSGWQLKIPSRGTAANPVIYTAQTPGGVTFTGRHQNGLVVTGDHNIVGGFQFRDCGAYFVRFIKANHNRLTDSKFWSCGEGDTNRLIEVKQLSHHNRIDHLLMDNILSNGITVFLDQFDVANGPSQYTRIDHNVIQNSGAGATNGREAIQIGQGSGWSGGAGTDMLETVAVVEYNYFTKMTREIIEIKSSRNLVRFNRLVDAEGSLSIRQGTENVVDSNFLHNTKSGITVKGENQVVTNNVVVGSRNFGISITAYGNFQLTETKWSSFPPTGNMLIAHNTLIDNVKGAIDLGRKVGYVGLTNAELPPYNITFINNVFAGSSGTLFSHIKSTGTQIVKNLYHTSGTASIGDQGTEPVVGDPKLDGNFKPTAGSIAASAGKMLSSVKLDAAGKTRPLNPALGAFEK